MGGRRGGARGAQRRPRRAHGWLAGEGYYTLGEVRRLRGDAAGAAQAYATARSLGHDALPGAALLVRDEGHPGDALAALRVGLADATRLGRARMLLAAVDLALAVGEPHHARTLVAELEDTASWFGTPGLGARADQGRAALLMAEGRPAQAIPLLERAAGVYRDQRHRYATATVHEDLPTPTGPRARTTVPTQPPRPRWRSTGASARHPTSRAWGRDGKARAG